ncbi:MAG: hypothetical protein F4187_05040 [Gemmatimonadetes bacterium]|nr:hypothetical protein [Gemmatimonadota bacterium]MYI07132.1 hypothetical protein [Gemmatimonadota bacterium]
MKKLVSLALVVMMLGASVPEHPVVGDAPTPPESYATGPVMCADGTLAIQEDECPEWVTLRRVHPDGTIERTSCKIEDEYNEVVDWDWIIIPTPIFPIPVPIPVTEARCNYGDCGDYARDDLIGEAGGGGTDS